MVQKLSTEVNGSVLQGALHSLPLILLTQILLFVLSPLIMIEAQPLPYVGLLRDIETTPDTTANSNPNYFVKALDGTYFLDKSGNLWFTDGTRSGTKQISLQTPEGYTQIKPRSLAPFKNTLVFASSFYDPSASVGCEPSYQTEGCRSQGLFSVNQTKTGVTLIREKIYIQESYPYIRNKLAILTTDTQIFFFGRESHDIENSYKSNSLWRSDGTRQGTQLVHSMEDGKLRIDERIVFGSKLYFFVSEFSESKRGLWSSDGTFDGTKRIEPNKTVFGLTPHLGRLYFLEAEDLDRESIAVLNADGSGVDKKELIADDHYALNSEPALVSVKNDLFFLAFGRSQILKDLWKVAPLTLAMERVAQDIDSPLELTECKGTLFLSVNTQSTGEEIFKLIGNQVTLAHDIRPGVSGSKPKELTAVGDQLFFTANDGDHNEELWQIDCNANGVASLAMDIDVGLNSSLPHSLSTGGSYLLFSADDGASGIEPWIASRNPLGNFPTPDPTITPTPRSTATPTKTATPVPILKPTVYPSDTVANWRRATRLRYSVAFSGSTREVIKIYRRGSSQVAYWIKTSLGPTTSEGREFWVSIPSRKLRAGSYNWCITATSSNGLSSLTQCASLRLK